MTLIQRSFDSRFQPLRADDDVIDFVLALLFDPALKDLQPGLVCITKINGKFIKKNLNK